MEVPNRLTLPAKLESLPAFNAMVMAAIEKQGIAEGKKAGIELALEEALVNVISYAYPNGEGDIHVECRDVAEKGFVIRIKDTGLPFNPLSLSSPDTHSDIEDRVVGGLGIHLIKTTMKEVYYERDDKKNILTMIP